MEIPECCEQLLRGNRVDVIRRQCSGEIDGRLHLGNEVLAAVAFVEVCFERGAVVRRERIIEVFGDEFDEFGAIEGPGHVATTLSKKTSSAARTFDRALCNSTRWLASVRSSVEHT